jgi:hypothetical protein
MESMEMFALLKQYGPLVGLVVFFIWRDWKREEQLTDRIVKLENENKDILLPLVQKSTEVFARNTEVMERLEYAFEKVNDDAIKRQS